MKQFKLKINMEKLVKAVVFSLLLASCGRKNAENVKVEDINDSCGCVDAIVLVTEDVFSFLASKGVSPPYAKNIEKLSEKDHETMRTKGIKLEEIIQHCKDLGIERKDMESCEAYNIAYENMKKIEK
jgi:hypothetical protein